MITTAPTIASIPAMNAPVIPGMTAVGAYDSIISVMKVEAAATMIPPTSARMPKIPAKIDRTDTPEGLIGLTAKFFTKLLFCYC